jgi:hypothetical protein
VEITVLCTKGSERYIAQIAEIPALQGVGVTALEARNQVLSRLQSTAATVRELVPAAKFVSLERIEVTD